METTHVILCAVSVGLFAGCSSPPPPPPMQAVAADGTAVLLKADQSWIYDTDRLSLEPSNAVVVCGWTPDDTFEGVLDNQRLAGEGLSMGIPVWLTTTVDVPGTWDRNAAGILVRGDIPQGVRQVLLNQIAAGRRAVIFLNVNTIDDESRAWLYEEMGIALLKTEPYHEIDGSAVAFFCEGLQADLGTYWKGKEWDIHASTELKVNEMWTRRGVIDGRVFSAYRPWGAGELIVTAVGADPYTLLRSTPVDDGAIERGDNLEIARRLLRWLGDGDRT